MKKNKIAVLLAVMVIAASTTLKAQEIEKTPSETKTIFKGSSIREKVKTAGIYVVPEIQYTGLAGSFAPTAGLSAMVQANKKWGIGAGVYSTFTDYAPKQLSSTKAYGFDAQYGGLKLEYTPKPDAAVHVSFPLMIGAGMASIDSVNESSYEKRDGRYENHGENDVKENDGNNEEVFFVVQPGIHLEANLFKYGKVFVGANYRLAIDKKDVTMAGPTDIYPQATAKQLSGFTVNAGLKIGIFDCDLRSRRSKAKL